VEVDVVLALVLLDKVLDDAVVKVLTAEVGVTGSREDLEDTVLDREKRDVKGTATEVVDDDLRLGLVLAVETVSDGGALGVVEVCLSATFLPSLSPSLSPDSTHRQGR
jgi:hypothetical protein